MKNPNYKTLALLLAPSWLSGLLVGLAALVGAAGTALLVRFPGSSLQQELFTLKNTGALPSASDTYQTLTGRLAQNTIISNLPLFLFWAGLGLIVYFLAVGIYAAMQDVAEVRDEMGYVNDPRHQLVREAIEQMLLRVVAVACWIAYLQLFLKVVLPYGLAAAQVAGGGDSPALGLGYGLLAFIVLAAGLHLQVIFLRLSFLRARLFGGATYS